MLVQGNVKLTAQHRRPHLQGRTGRHFEHGSGVIQDHAVRVVQSHGPLLGAAPIDHGPRAPKGVAARTQDAVHFHAGLAHLGHGIALQRGRLQTAFGCHPASLAAAPLGRQDHCQIGARQLSTHRRGAHHGRDACAAQNQLAHAHRAAIGQGHADVLLAFNEHLAVQCQHVGDVGMRQTAQACFAAAQADRIGSGGGAYGRVQVLAPTAPTHMHVVQREFHTGHAGQGHIPLGRDGVALDHGTAGHLVAQQHCTTAIGQRGAHAAQAQGARQTVKTDTQFGDRGGPHQLRGGNQLQTATELAQALHADLTRGDGDLLSLDTVGKAHLARRRGQARFHGHVDRTAQGVDFNDGIGIEGHCAIKATQGRRARRVKGIAVLGGVTGFAGNDQAHVDIGQRHTGRSGAHGGVHIGRADQQIARRLRGSLGDTCHQAWQGKAGQLAAAHHPEAAGLRIRHHRHIALANARQLLERCHQCSLLLHGIQAFEAHGLQPVGLTGHTQMKLFGQRAVTQQQIHGLGRADLQQGHVFARQVALEADIPCHL